MQYPNKYYAELAERIISNPSLRMKEGEVCFYQETASSFKTTTTTTTETRQNYYSGMLFITNMRMVFQCQVDSFDLLITQIKSVKQYSNGFEVISGRKSYKVMTDDMQGVLYVIDLINKAQTT